MKISKFISRNREISVGFLLFMILAVSVLVASNQSPKSVVEELGQPAKFVIASWDYPDEYGQGIYGFRFYENSTGSWVAAPWYYVGGELDGLPYYFLHSYDPYTLNWSEGVAMKLRVYSTFNNTVIGAIDEADGQNYQRHNVTVTFGGVPVISQNNFTYYDVAPDGDYWAYEYEVIFNFLPVSGAIYTVALTYELYFEDTFEEYLHDCSSVNGIAYYSNSNLGGNDYGIGSDGSLVDFWILPDDGSAEGVVYKIDFANIANPDDDINITVRYKVEGATNFFYYRLEYDDATGDYSDYGTSTSWATINMTLDAGKTLDYMYIHNYDDPSATSSGNLSVWIDYILIYSLDTDWYEISETDILFIVPFNEWGLNTGIIILGLILVPASTLYLVYGGRKALTMDKFFFALIAFIIGWALIIGGVMP